MGLKKYEIITVGSDKRVRALRSWQVGDRYVNIGDVGGIVYDEKTLSQDGLCWLFRGNFGFPGARIGGDSIVDVSEATLSTTGAPAVDILGSSVVVGSPLRIASDQTAADAVVLTADDFEQGRLDYVKGSNWETWKKPDPNFLRTKALIFAGGVSKTLKLSVPGYDVRAFSMDADGTGIAVTAMVDTGAGVTLEIPAGQYFALRLAKKPGGAIVPADATAAQITFTGTYETKLSIIDSRVEINPATGTGVTIIKPGGTYTMAPGAKYPEAIIRNSRVSMNVHATADRIIRFMGQIIGSTAVLDSMTGNPVLAGTYSNVKSLTASGVLTSSTDVSAYNSIQATDCNDFAVSPTVFRGFNAAYAANMPFIFQGCNVPDGKFYHHAQIANTYKNIDFAKASVDLGKAIASGEVLASSEVEGMYRLYSTTGSAFGGLVEGYDSVKSLNMSGTAGSYGTTIYKDAYVSGKFGIAGTNVFGNKARSHPMAQVLNVQPRAVQGTFNALTAGETITGGSTGGSTHAVRVRSNTFFRLNRAEGLKVSGIPGGIQCFPVTTDTNNKIITVSPGWTSGELTVANNNDRCYLLFKKTDNSPITPADLAGVTVTVYNGCKIVNTGATAVNMKGNIRVEDNATLINASVVGSGCFGGNCVASGLTLNGCAFMDNNAVLVKTSEGGTIRRLYMRDNSYAAISAVTVFGLLDLRDNAVFSPASYGVSEADIIMRDNATITGGLSANGVLKMEGNAAVPGGTVTIAGDITLCGSYNQTANKTWTGKRVIDSVDAPEYDNNVKTQYDF